MNTMKAGVDDLSDWAKQDVRAHIAFMTGVHRQLTASGELVSAEGLTFPGEAKVVRAAEDGSALVDGSFPESKEFLAGFWIIDVVGPERAYAIAGHISAAPGPGGARLNMPIEVRPVASGPPED